jgi:hypothetical protein
MELRKYPRDAVLNKPRDVGADSAVILSINSPEFTSALNSAFIMLLVLHRVVLITGHGIMKSSSSAS